MFVRHGETLWNIQGKIQGSEDSPLTPNGRKQAEELAKRIVQYIPKAVYSSDLHRAQTTAKYIADELGLAVVIDKRLRERNMGVLEGLSWEEALNKYGDVRKKAMTDGSFALPGGESMNGCQDRMKRWALWAVEKHEAGPIIAVSHGGSLNLFFRWVIGLPVHTKRSFHVLNASLNVFSWEQGRFMLRTFGDIAHLDRIRTIDEFET